VISKSAITAFESAGMTTNLDELGKKDFIEIRPISADDSVDPSKSDTYLSNGTPE